MGRSCQLLQSCPVRCDEAVIYCSLALYDVTKPSFTAVLLCTMWRSRHSLQSCPVRCDEAVIHCSLALYDVTKTSFTAVLPCTMWRSRHLLQSCPVRCYEAVIYCSLALYDVTKPSFTAVLLCNTCFGCSALNNITVAQTVACVPVKRSVVWSILLWTHLLCGVFSIPTNGPQLVHQWPWCVVLSVGMHIKEPLLLMIE